MKYVSKLGNDAGPVILLAQDPADTDKFVPVKAVDNGDGTYSIESVVRLSGSYLQQDVTIAQGETESSEIDFRNYKYFAFEMPAEWTAATLTLKGSAVSGGTKVDIVDDEGETFAAMTVAVDKIYVVDAQALQIAGLHFLSFVSSVAQEAARTIKVMLKA